MGSTYFIKRIFRTKRKPHYGRERNPRPKSFRTEESARKWAEENKIKDYDLVNMKEGKQEKKIRVVPKPAKQK